MVIFSLLMKKIGFLFLGIVVVIVILSLQNMGGASSQAKRIIRKVASEIEEVVIEVYQEIRSFSTELERM
jgi:hypothetical protein